MDIIFPPTAQDGIHSSVRCGG